MTPKKALKNYLTDLIKGRETALAGGLGISVEALKVLADGNDEHPITMAQAITLGNLTDTSPKAILDLQLDVQLEEAGVKPVKKVKPSKPTIARTGKSPTVMPSHEQALGRARRGSVVR